MATTAHGSPLALSVPTRAPLHVRCSPPAYGAPSCTSSPQRCPDGRRPPPPSLRCYAQDDLGPSPTKASLGHASARAKPLRRLELFPDLAAKRPKLDGCARPPRVGAEAPATATSSGSDGLSSSSVLEDDGEEELSLRSRHGSSVLEDAGCTHVGGQGLEDAGGCGSPLGGGDTPLPPLALAAELPEGIRGQLHPTPLEDMLQEDRRLAAGGAAQLPADALLLACPSQTPWVKRCGVGGAAGRPSGCTHSLGTCLGHALLGEGAVNAWRPTHHPPPCSTHLFARAGCATLAAVACSFWRQSSTRSSLRASTGAMQQVGRRLPAAVSRLCRCACWSAPALP